MKALAIIELILIIILGISLNNYNNALVASRNEVSLAQSNLQTAQSDIIKLTNELNIANANIESVKIEKDHLNTKINSLNGQIGQLTKNNTDLQNQVNTLQKKLQGTTPYYSPSGKNLKTTNQENTHNPTFSELVSFLNIDSTDKLDYIDNKFMCGDFSQLLHDNAERNGIRSGIVVINFIDGSVAHAFNAFMTTDKGLVYIDDTGIKPDGVIKCKCDAIGYAVIGKPYNSVDMKYITGIDYSDYIALKLKFEQYQSDIDTYNKNSDILNDSTRDQQFRVELATKLRNEYTRLTDLKDTLPSCFRSEMGIVKSIEIFW